MPFRKGSPRWVSITLKHKKLHEDTKTLLTRASSIFVQFQGTNSSSGLPNVLFQGCSNLAVLTLSCCAFSFAWPPFHHSSTLHLDGPLHLDERLQLWLRLDKSATSAPSFMPKPRVRASSMHSRQLF
uniref:Uncharacterized protein n=1 Tax=Aegilops tauschii subsp. strangulata TaxID=200361 RepID=A0A453N0V7_AEGTS